MISLDTKGKQISLGDGCKLWQLVKIVENNENTSFKPLSTNISGICSFRKYSLREYKF